MRMEDFIKESRYKVMEDTGRAHGRGSCVAPEDHVRVPAARDISHASIIGIHGQELGSVDW